MKRAVAIGLVTIFCGCPRAAENVGPLRIRAADLESAQIPAVEASGMLDGERFALKAARFRVELMKSRRRLDLYLTDAPITRCGLPVAEPDAGTRVWFRFPGRTRLHPGEYRAEVGASEPFSVHYERHVGSEWEGVREGVALVTVTSDDRAGVVGRVHVCFPGGEQNCIKGSFHATQCISELDVDDPVFGSAHETPQTVEPPPVRELQ